MAAVPIQNLTPETAPPADRSIRGVITLSWPYSSATKQCALLVADADFRLRNRKGQVRVRFTGASAEAVAKSHVGIGDEVILHLQGASWAQDVGQTRTPGKSVEGELLYGRRLQLQVARADGEVNIDVDAPAPAASPVRVEKAGAPLSATPLPKAVNGLRYSLDGGRESVGTYNSPAFVKRLRLSGDSFLTSPYDPFTDADNEQPSKKQRLSFGGVAQWKYAVRSPSPVQDRFSPEMDVEVETEVTRDEIQGPELPSIDGTVEVMRSSPQDAPPSMLPPPLPRLQMPDEASASEQDRQPRLDASQKDGPSTPKLQAVPNSALPLPSPFPTEAAEGPFESFSSGPAMQVPGSSSIESPASAAVASPLARQTATAELEDEEEPPLADDVREEASPSIKATAGAQNVMGTLSKALAVGDNTFSDDLQSDDDTSDRDEAMEDERDRRRTLPLHVQDSPSDQRPDDSRTQDLLRSPEHLHTEPPESGLEQPMVHDDSTTRQMRTPAKQSVGAFGLDGASTAAPSSQSTPQSDKQQVMARTFSSLFGFQSIEASVPPATKPTTVGTPTPASVSSRTSFGWFQAPTTPNFEQSRSAPKEVEKASMAINPAERVAEQSRGQQVSQDTDVEEVQIGTAESITANTPEGEATAVEPGAVVLEDAGMRADNTRRPETVRHYTSADPLEQQEQSPDAPADAQWQEDVVPAPVVEEHYESREIKPSADHETTIGIYGDHLRPPTGQHESASQTLTMDEAPVPASSAVEVIELGSSSDVDEGQLQNEGPALADSQSIPAEAAALPMAVDAATVHEDTRSSPPVPAYNTKSNDDFFRSKETESGEALSSPLPTSQLDELEHELPELAGERQDTVQAIVEHPSADDLASDQTTPRARSFDATTAHERTPRSSQPKGFVRFPAERVIEDSQSEGRSGTLSTQPTPTAETFDVITVPDREPKSRRGMVLEQQKPIQGQGSGDEQDTLQNQPSLDEVAGSQIPSPRHVPTEVIELGSSSPVGEASPLVQSTVDNIAHQFTEPTSPSTQRAPSNRAPDDELDEQLSLVPNAAPLHDQSPVPAPSEANVSSVMREASVADEADLAAPDVVAEPSSTAVNVTYPTLPPSPLQSQPLQESIAMEQTTQHETMRSALPPTPQLTQTASDMLESVRAEVSQHLQDRVDDGEKEGEDIEQASDRGLTNEAPQPRELYKTDEALDVVMADDDAGQVTLPTSHLSAPEGRISAGPEHADVITTDDDYAQREQGDEAVLANVSKGDEQPLRVGAPASTTLGATKDASTRPLRKTPRRSLRQSLSSVPDVLSKWFSPKRSSGITHETPSKQRVAAIVEAAEEDDPDAANGKVASEARHPTLAKSLSNGIMTATGYFTQLVDLERRLNTSSQDPFTSNSIDVMAVVTDSTTEPQRAKGGPRDYYNIFRVKDSSLSSDVTIRVEVFRPWKATLPFAEVGDVVLLRAFAVKSKKRQPYLLSTDASAWCVWRYAEAKTADEEAGKPMWARKHSEVAHGITREEIKGPPVELGEEERQHARSLHEWWNGLHDEANTDGQLSVGNVEAQGISSKL